MLRRGGKIAVRSCLGGWPEPARALANEQQSDGEEARVCEVADSPRRVLRQTSHAIAEARFTGKGDREAVQRMLAEI